MICGDDGAMMVIACDQRGGMRTILAASPEDQAKIGTDILGDTKIDIGTHLARHATAVLVDPLCALPRMIDGGHLHRSTALLIGLGDMGALVLDGLREAGLPRLTIIGHSPSQWTAATASADGRVYSVGATVGGVEADFILARHLPDGRPDLEFAEGNGWVRTRLGRSLASAGRRPTAHRSPAVAPSVWCAGNGGHGPSSFGPARHGVGSPEVRSTA